MRKSVVVALSLAFALAPAAVQGQTDLLGDKDCFGTGDVCLEDGVTWLPGAWGSEVQGPGDPVWSDIASRSAVPLGWTHSIGAGSYSAASVAFRTLGLGDIAGPYDVFADGVKIGEIPLDGTGHILVETFSFAIDPLALADGFVDISIGFFDTADLWAIDYSELSYTAAVPEPASILLMASGFLGLVGVRVRRRS